MLSYPTFVLLSSTARQQNSLAARPDWAVTAGWQEERLILPGLVLGVGWRVGDGDWRGKKENGVQVNINKY